MMTPVNESRPATPSEAVGCHAALDAGLDTELFRALGDPTRARLLACLIPTARPCSVTEIAACCAVDFSVVARHLRALAAAGVLTAEKRGRTVWYEADTAGLAARLRGLADAIEDAESAPRDCGEGEGDACC